MRDAKPEASRHEAALSVVGADAEKKRLQLYFGADSLQRLRRIRSNVNYTSDNDVVREALHLLDWVLTKRAEGYEVQIAKGRKVRAVELLLGSG
jgi:hypothetical protein